MQIRKRTFVIVLVASALVGGSISAFAASPVCDNLKSQLNAAIVTRDNANAAVARDQQGIAALQAQLAKDQATVTTAQQNMDKIQKQLTQNGCPIQTQ